MEWKISWLAEIFSPVALQCNSCKVATARLSFCGVVMHCSQQSLYSKDFYGHSLESDPITTNMFPAPFFYISLLKAHPWVWSDLVWPDLCRLHSCLSPVDQHSYLITIDVCSLFTSSLSGDFGYEVDATLAWKRITGKWRVLNGDGSVHTRLLKCLS